MPNIKNRAFFFGEPTDLTSYNINSWWILHCADTFYDDLIWVLWTPISGGIYQNYFQNETKDW